MNLGCPLTALRGIGPKRAASLGEAGLGSVEDLLWYLPAGYEPQGERVEPSQVVEGGPFRVKGELRRIRHRRLRGRGGLVEAELWDELGCLDVAWFQPAYFADHLKRDPRVTLRGTVRRRGDRLQLGHPEILPESGLEEPPFRPRYRALAGLSGRQMGNFVGQVLESLDPSEPPERLPADLLKRLELPELPQALRAVHRPPLDGELETWQERCAPPFRRLAFGELFAHQQVLARRYGAKRRQEKQRIYGIDDRVRQVAREILPFKLTVGQKRVLLEMVADLVSPHPMMRLLQGDVGSGKTIVAALLMMLAAESGISSVLLAPTELLAEQHMTSLRELFGERYPLSLWTAQSGGVQVLQVEALSRAEIFVGTHALLEDHVSLPGLGLVIIDEQHRFGVSQRQVMVEKGNDVDLLVMSATPIPRTLALSGYGDLDLSVLDGLPPGRRPLETVVVPKARRKEIYSRLRADLRAGAQAFIVFPAIRDIEAPGLVSLEKMAPRIEAGLPGVITARYHGQIPWSERQGLMERFRSGEIQLLLATTVIEVGVDVPQASAMIIEGAERFGLAQLHQLRGRVGRGSNPSWCGAVHGALSGKGERRLQAFSECRDGFAIAERDLAIRGPGDLLGELQAGMIAFQIADLKRDGDLLEEARRAARESELSGDPLADNRTDTTMNAGLNEQEKEVRWFVS